MKGFSKANGKMTGFRGKETDLQMKAYLRTQC